MKKSLLLIALIFSLNAKMFSINPDSGNELEIGHEHHNHYELELSLNNDNHVEYTGSLYFLPQKKVQVTADQTFHHFASVVVQELPFRNSHWGTFIGVGGTYGYDEHEDHTTHEMITEQHAAIIAQSGLAYAFDNHWSTGFTFSPGYDLNEHASVFGLTFDLVFGF